MTKPADLPDPLEQALVREMQPAPAPPGLGALLVWTGRLGWGLVLPILAGAALGRAIDSAIGHGVTYSAGLILLGAAIGLRWMWSQLNGERK
jgi:ATP synthase protein I